MTRIHEQIHEPNHEIIRISMISDAHDFLHEFGILEIHDKIMTKLSLPRKSEDANSVSLNDFIESYKKELSDKFIGILKELDDKYLSFQHKIS